ncbi:MAG: tetratricopeptide repeat protein, partial [Mariprofundus sp.]
MLKTTLFLTMLFASVQAFAVTAAEPTLASAEALLEQGREADAITQLKQLLKSKPANYQAWFLLGVTEAGQRRFHDAIASFRQVISLQPKLAEPHNNLAVIYNELGDFRAAVQELEASLQLKPDYVTAQENIGDLYVKLAADAYRQALDKADNAALRQRYKRLLRIRFDDSAQPEAVDATTVAVPDVATESTEQA